MRILAFTALALCAPAPALYAAEPVETRPAPAIVQERTIFVDPVVDFTRAERARQWQAELAARALEIQRAQTAWLPPVHVGPIREDVVRDRPTYSNALFALNRPYGFVPEPYYEMPTPDRRLIAYQYQWYPYGPASQQPGFVSTANYPARVGFPRGPAEVAIQPVTPGPGPSVAEREAAIEIRAASVDIDGRELR